MIEFYKMYFEFYINLYIKLNLLKSICFILQKKKKCYNKKKINYKKKKI